MRPPMERRAFFLDMAALEHPYGIALIMLGAVIIWIAIKLREDKEE
jgi:hypothetical protein